MSPPRKKKIAILGGGLGALSTAFYLTRRGQRDRHEVTVYQMGWRLGGKGASGRDRTRHDRIEEHGVHVFMGMYHNAFRLMRACYGELKRPLRHPLSRCFPGITSEPAFKPHHTATFWEDRGLGRWSPWHIEFSKGPRRPGRPGAVEPSLLGLLVRLIRLVRSDFDKHRQYFPQHEARPTERPAALALQESWSRIGRMALRARCRVPVLKPPSSLSLVEKAAWRLTPRRVRAEGALDERLGEMCAVLDDFYETEMVPLQAAGPEATGGLEDDEAKAKRRHRLLLSTAIVILRGILRDRVISEGFDHLDDEEFTAWLRRHGASNAVADSAIVKSLYELGLGFAPANRQQPMMGAGTTLRSAMRIFLDYNGGIIWKMQGGMGDVVFAPLYEVLKRRGVQFRFFHRVADLVPSDDGSEIEQIRVHQQVRLTDRDGETLDIGHYKPLFAASYGEDGRRTLPSWPSEPVYRNDAANVYIEEKQAERLQELHDTLGLDLESAWIDWQDERERTLEKGKDFDDVVLAIPVGALPYAAPTLLQRLPDLAKMVKGIPTVASQACQLWMNRSATELNGGDQDVSEPMMGSYALGDPRPWPNWSGMSQLIPVEQLPQAAEVRHIGYLYTQIENIADESPPYARMPDQHYPGRMALSVRQSAEDFLTRRTGGLWPGATLRGSQTLDWNILVDDSGAQGPARLDAQYFRANVNPSDRYVSHTTGSLGYRRFPWETGLDNLYFAGDWTRNGLNSGCAESATMSGVMAANAISGTDLPVYWAQDGFQAPTWLVRILLRIGLFFVRLYRWVRDLLGI